LVLPVKERVTGVGCCISGMSAVLAELWMYFAAGLGCGVTFVALRTAQGKGLGVGFIPGI
jgi:hypothetical protein